MDKLAAVNYVLQGAGRGTVPALDTDGNSAAANAERIIDEVELEVQTDGWHYNDRRGVEITPDGSNFIVVPDGTLTIDSDGRDLGRNVVQNGDRLYDAEDNTFEFTGSLICRYVLRFEWECIPIPVRLYMAAEAACRYNLRHGKLELRQRLEFARDGLRVKAKQFDTNARGTNVLDTVKGHWRRSTYAR